MKKESFLKKLFQTGAKSIVMGIGLTIGVVATVAFAATWVYNPQTASNGDPLTVSSWNEVVNAIEELQIQADAASAAAEASGGASVVVQPGGVLPADKQYCRQNIHNMSAGHMYNDSGTWRVASYNISGLSVSTDTAITDNECPDAPSFWKSTWTLAAGYGIDYCVCYDGE